MAPMYIMMPIFGAFGLHWGSPCKPSMTLFLLIPECLDSGINKRAWWNLLAKSIIYLFNYWSWIAAMFASLYSMSVFISLCVLSFGDLVKYFKTNAESNFERDLYRNGQYYRKLQVLGCLCNEVQKSDIMGIMTFGSILTLIFALNSVLTIPWTRENAHVLAFFGMVTFNATANFLVCFGAMAEVYDEFVEALDQMKGRGVLLVRRVGKGAKWKNRFYISCTPVQFKFSGHSYVDRLTPLNFIAFSIDQTVSLLLI